MALPAIGEDSIDVVFGDNLARHLRHEFKVVGAKSTSDPALGRGPVAALVALDIDGHPFRMRGGGLVADRMRIGARNDDHVHLAATLDQVAKRIGSLFHPGAAMMVLDFGGIIRDAAASTEAGGIGVNAAEIIE